MATVRNTIMVDLLDALKVIRDSNDYEAQLAQDPVMYHKNYLNDSTPCLMLIDELNDEVLVEDASNRRSAFDVLFIGFVTGDSFTLVQEDANALVSSIRKFIDSGPDLGDNVLDFQYIETLGGEWDAENVRAEVSILARIIYYVGIGEE